jgi:CRP/FNR family transcriptional regulator
VNNTPAADDLFAAFPALAELDGGARQALLAGSRELALDAGAPVFQSGQSCAWYLLLRQGTVRVHLMEEEGHEIVLYRLGRGETCILTTTAILGATPYLAHAIAETDVVATGIPLAAFESLIARCDGFRRFVFASHALRIVDLMRIVTDVAFTRIRVRLARCLAARMDASHEVPLTHEAIAVEIGTAREVVSRNLKFWSAMDISALDSVT